MITLQKVIFLVGQKVVNVFTLFKLKAGVNALYVYITKLIGMQAHLIYILIPIKSSKIYTTNNDNGSYT